MQSLSEFIDSNLCNEYFEDILSTIEELELPKNVSKKITEIIEENEYEIKENRYNRLISDAEEYKYEAYKEIKIFNG